MASLTIGSVARDDVRRDRHVGGRSLLGTQYSGPTLVDEDLPRILEERFGPERLSMGLEEWFIRDFLGDIRGGVFVDVGAWDPTKGSNTYRLERDFGWSGLAVDAIEEFAPKYKVIRPKSQLHHGLCRGPG